MPLHQEKRYQKTFLAFTNGIYHMYVFWWRYSLIDWNDQYGSSQRCSSAFLTEERSALKQKRQKIRLLQQRKFTDVSHCKDLPEEIPLPLVIGTKVTGNVELCCFDKVMFLDNGIQCIDVESEVFFLILCQSGNKWLSSLTINVVLHFNGFVH